MTRQLDKDDFPALLFDPEVYRKERMSNDLFTNRPPTAEQAVVLDGITSAMHDAEATLNQLPNSRFRSLALTKLEECSMWAKKAAVFTVGVE